jgi:hypothetical protein
MGPSALKENGGNFGRRTEGIPTNGVAKKWQRWDEDEDAAAFQG